MSNRLSRVRRRLGDYDADAILLSSRPDIRWACGFTGSNGLLVVGPQKAVFVTDGRYTEQAQQEVAGAKIEIAKDGLMSRILDQGYLEDLDRVAFQADHVTAAKYHKLKENCPDIGWMPRSNILTRFVAKKEDEEVERIREAQAITESVFKHVLDLIAPGVTEREISAEITYQHLTQGADQMAFDPIVASGPNGARPHGRPTDRVIETGELVVLDMGCVFNGYASDMTRTVAVGEPPASARTGYEVVLRAQREAIAAAQAGLTGKELDAVARDVIEEGGLGEYFSHGLGHGIGLQVHEWPRVSHTVDEELPVDSCITIEPGVYVPEEEYGVRIEDIVFLQEDGCKNLTRTPKELATL